MITQYKYIRTKSGFTIWPDLTSVFHAHMAKLAKEEVLSAGFCQFYAGEFTCYGHSESLGIRSQPTDTAAINNFFNPEI